MQKVIVQLYPNYLSASFDTLYEGDLFNNIPIYTDTILSLHLNTIYGCDSIINRKIKVNKNLIAFRILRYVDFLRLMVLQLIKILL